MQKYCRMATGWMVLFPLNLPFNHENVFKATVYGVIFSWNMIISWWYMVDSEHWVNKGFECRNFKSGEDPFVMLDYHCEFSEFTIHQRENVRNSINGNLAESILNTLRQVATNTSCKWFLSYEYFARHFAGQTQFDGIDSKWQVKPIISQRLNLTCRL